MFAQEYLVYIKQPLLQQFILTYLEQDDLDSLQTILQNVPHVRPFWGNTHYKYIIVKNIFFLYEIAENEKKVAILGAKFNNKRKTFNFANTPTQQKTMKKWIDNFPLYYPNS